MMSHEAKRWCSRQRIVSGSMKSVLAVLAYLHKDGADLYPSQRYLADETGISERTVREALRLLEYFGAIRRSSRSRGGKYGRLSDKFHIVLDREFTLGKKVIADGRKALRGPDCNRHNSPVLTNLQPAQNAIATGTIRRGIGEEQQKELIHVEGNTEVAVGHRGKERPRLTVIAGGLS